MGGDEVATEERLASGKSQLVLELEVELARYGVTRETLDDACRELQRELFRLRDEVLDAGAKPTGGHTQKLKGGVASGQAYPGF